MQNPHFLTALTLLSTVLAIPAAAQSTDPMRACMTDDWLNKSDAAFAADCADLAFDGTLRQREFLAWLFFIRVNRLIEDKAGVSDTDSVPVWMAWPTDADTFTCSPNFTFMDRDVILPSGEAGFTLQAAADNRKYIVPVTEKKVLAGDVAVHEPDAANEEVTRNQLSYDYVTGSGLNSTPGVISYIAAGNAVDLPVGSIELKASWLKVPPSGPPEGALTFNFESGEHWFRGLHIMAKMAPAPEGDEVFYSETPSWFWTTFEFNNNTGVQHVRDDFITQRAPLNPVDIDALLEWGGIAGLGFNNYAPNGTQIRFTVDGTGEEPVILGHTDMEDFAGTPNTAQPRYWRAFDASCHTCHATASINLDTGDYFPFTVPTGALTPEYNAPNPNTSQPPLALGDGFVPLDFMWPIAFQAQSYCPPKE
ncbi:hypothetical protein ACJ5NV_09620 [Loktanella agnita]|uniref:hypothetical protein n=1 Tax=Loktanella agnita TaxID=287097 RepID=UPI003985DFC9